MGPHKSQARGAERCGVASAHAAPFDGERVGRPFVRSASAEEVLWQRNRLLAGECLGTVPDTTLACGESEQYCSPMCLARATPAGEFHRGVREGYLAALVLVDYELAEMLKHSDDLVIRRLLQALRDGLDVRALRSS